MRIPPGALVKFWIVVVATAVVLQMACSHRPATKFAPTERSDNAKNIQAMPDKAIVYVCFENNEKFKHFFYDVDLDHRFFAKPRIGSFARLELDPGQHELSVQIVGYSKLIIQVEAGKVYFVSQTWRKGREETGFMRLFFHGQQKVALSLVPESEGLQSISNYALLDTKPIKHK